MIINIVYIIISLILIFVSIIAFKAINRGVAAKQNIREQGKKKSNLDANQNQETINPLITDEIIKLKKLHDDGILTKEEFEKSKNKIIDS